MNFVSHQVPAHMILKTHTCFTFSHLVTKHGSKKVRSHSQYGLVSMESSTIDGELDITK